jgi:hypothetical protein
MTGHMTKLGMGCSALVYYVDEPDGFHLVVTTQRGLTDRAAVERFETVLAAGQSAAISTCTSPSRTPPLPAGDFPHSGPEEAAGTDHASRQNASSADADPPLGGRVLLDLAVFGLKIRPRGAADRQMGAAGHEKS